MANLTTIKVSIQANAKNFKKNVDDSKKALDKLNKTTSKVAPLQTKVSKGFQNLAGSIAAVQGPLGPVAGRISSIGAIIGRINPLFIVATAAFIGFGLALKKTVSAGTAAQTQLLKLDAILKATGDSAKLTSQEIQQLAVDIGRDTLASVQGVRDAAGVLLTFRSITGDTFREALRLSQDLAAVGFGSIKTASLQLGKALEEPEIGLSALRRVGVSFTEEQKELIKVLSLTGETAKAQALILKALKEQVGGAGEGAAGGLAGAIDTLGENFTLFFERSRTGRKIINNLTRAFLGLANALGEKIVPFRELPEDLEELDKLLFDNIDKVHKLSDELREAIKNKSKFFDSGEAKKNRSELLFNIQILNEENESIRKKVEILKKENSEKEKARKIDKTIDETNAKLARGTKRRIEDLRIKEKDKLLTQELRKLEDALISKLGEGPIARAKIIAIIDEEKKKRQELTELQRQEIEALERVKSISTGIGKSFEDAGRKITDAFIEGKSGALDFKAILRELLIDIQKTVIQVIFLDRLKKSITGVISNVLGGAVPSATPANTFDLDQAGRIRGGIATGGSVQANNPRIVGERGPELFVPRTAGVVTPSSLTPGKMGGGQPIVINQNLNFALGVTNTVRSEIANLLPTIQQSTLSAVSDAKLRGGKFAKAFGG
tara:strand:- start:11 stop:2005 length:1995 start_codon:yes stop_codon:yes gene_type:complete